MARLPRSRRAESLHSPSGQSGMTMTELLVGAAIVALVGGTIAGFLGVAVQSKMIASTRAGDTATARATLAWMADRLRNAGLNLRPREQFHPRCRDRLVAQDPNLLPTEHGVFASGEMLKTTAAAADEVFTIGYYLAPDPNTGNQVVMEYKQPCTSGATSLPGYSARLSDPKLNVTGLTFQYFDTGGRAITSLTSSSELRKVTAIRITLVVQGAEGRSGLQQVALARSVVLWNPEPNTNDWVNPNENY